MTRENTAVGALEAELKALQRKVEALEAFTAYLFGAATALQQRAIGGPAANINALRDWLQETSPQGAQDAEQRMDQLEEIAVAPRH